jgi:hypothetical protein
MCVCVCVCIGGEREREIYIYDHYCVIVRDKSRLKSGNDYCHSMQNHLSFSLLSKHINIKMYGIIVLPVGLFGCETWSSSLREERRLRVFENRVLRRTFGPKTNEVRGA